MTGTFVSIGNGTQDFSRLLDEVKRIADQLPQPVIVQHGRTAFECDAIISFDFTDEAGFLEHLRACSLFITHGGGGSVFSAIKLGKKAVVVPRRKAHNEIVDDHQMAFTEELAKQGKIVPVYDITTLKSATEAALKSPNIPTNSQGNNDAIAAISEALASFAPSASDIICLVTPSGGHLTEIREMADTYRGNSHFFVLNTPIVEPEDMQGKTIYLTLSQRDWKFVINLWEAFSILRTRRPKVILTTGGGFSVAFTLVGKMLSIPTVYIETVAKVVVPTLTGRFMYRLADRFLYQWPYLKKYFPNGRYIGLILLGKPD